MAQPKYLSSHIHEVIITTLTEDGKPHVAPMGIKEVKNHFLIQPYKPSSTYDNLKRHRQCSVSFIDDVRVFAGALTGRRQWDMAPCQQIEGFYLQHALTHTELEIVAFDDSDPRACFRGAVIHDVQHAPFRGFNRAQCAVIDAAILASRLDWLPAEKIRQELAYLSIAIDKTAGPREQEAWDWLMAKFQAAGYDRP